MVLVRYFSLVLEIILMCNFIKNKLDWVTAMQRKFWYFLILWKFLMEELKKCFKSNQPFSFPRFIHHTNVHTLLYCPFLYLKSLFWPGSCYNILINKPRTGKSFQFFFYCIGNFVSCFIYFNSVLDSTSATSNVLQYMLNFC